MENNHSVNQNSEKKLLRDIRKQLQLTQQDLANFVGIDRTNLSKFENGKEIPDWLLKARRLNLLLKKAGYTIDDIVLPPNDN